MPVNAPESQSVGQPGHVSVRDILCLAGLALPTAVVCTLIARHAWTIGIPSEWTWGYVTDCAPFIVALPAAVFAGLMALVVGLCLRRGLGNHMDEAIAVFLCMALCLGVIRHVGNSTPLGTLQPYPVTVAPANGGYYGEAVRVDGMRRYLADYAKIISELRVDDLVRGHVADHPAGPVLFHWMVNRAMERMPRVAERFLPQEEDVRAEVHRQAESILRMPVSRGELAGVWASALLFRLAYWLSLLAAWLIGRTLCGKEAGLLAMALSALVPVCTSSDPTSIRCSSSLPFSASTSGSFRCAVRAPCGRRPPLPRCWRGCSGASRCSYWLL